LATLGFLAPTASAQAPAVSAQAPNEKQVQLAVNMAMVAAYHEWDVPNARAIVKEVVPKDENQAEAILYYDLGHVPGVSRMGVLAGIDRWGTARALLQRVDGAWFVTEIQANELHCQFGCSVKIAVPPEKSRPAKRHPQGGSGANAPPPPDGAAQRPPD